MAKFTTPKYSDKVLDALARFEEECFGREVIDRTVDWIIDLYDPESGGFYQETSSKETEGFCPDYESSAKVFYELRQFGVLKTENLREVLTPQIADALADYAKRYQVDEDGFWYQPPWGKNICDSMRMYQTGCAQGLLRQTGERPKFKTPEERAKQNESPKNISEKILTERELLFANKFNSKEDFKKWFDGYLPWNRSIYTSGSLLLSHGSIIQSAGYLDYMIELITEKLNPETGFLDNGSGLKNYDTMSGTYKVSNYYLESFDKGDGVEMPYADKVLESTAEVILSHEPECHACHIANPWALLRNAIQSQKDPDQKLIEMYLELLPALLDRTREKIVALRSPEGVYSYMPGVGSWGNQAMLAALPLWEGETGGVSMALATRGHVYNALMLPKPDLVCSMSIDEVVERLSKVKPNVKIKYDIGCDIDFTTFPEGTIKEKQGFRYTGDVSVAKDPLTDKNCVCIKATGYDSPVFNIDVGTKSGKGFVCEYDIRFDVSPGSKEAELMETRFGSWDFAVRLAHRNEAEGVRLTTFTNKSENVSEIADRSAYHHIKVEYIPDGKGDGETRHYVDGVFSGKSSYWKGTYNFLKPAVDNIPCVTFRVVPSVAYTAYISSFKMKEI